MCLATIKIDNELLPQVNRKQKQIGEYLLSCNLDYTDKVGLLDGLAGVGLLLSLFYRNSDDARFLDKLNQTIGLINEKIYTGKAAMVSYCSGIAGFAWLIIYLKENDLIEIDLDDYLSDIDKVLLQYAKLMIEKKEYDQLHHAVGIGFYFLKRGNFSIVESIINGLYHDRENVGGYLTWRRVRPQSKKEIVDFGLAHGIPGTLFFLYKCYLQHILPQKCSEMMRENISFMLDHMNGSGVPSYFPFSIEYDKISQFDSKQNMSRLAWCYGDLTALYILFHVSSVFPVQIDAIRMLEQVAQRRNDTETRVKDAGFCHGASGITHIFNRLYYETQNSYFEEAANYWLKRTLLLGNETEGVVGYVFTEGNKEHPLDLLVGISGVGSTLLSFQNPKLIHWDESVFLI